MKGTKLVEANEKGEVIFSKLTRGAKTKFFSLPGDALFSILGERQA